MPRSAPAKRSAAAAKLDSESVAAAAAASVLEALPSEDAMETGEAAAAAAAAAEDSSASDEDDEQQAAAAASDDAAARPKKKKKTKRASAGGTRRKRKATVSAATVARRVAAAEAAAAFQASFTTHTGPAFIDRCDANALSLVLACLNSEDFRSAQRVSKHWHAAAAVNTAWPALSVRSFIDRLQADNYDDPAQRRLRVRTKDVPLLVASPLRRVNDVELRLWDPPELPFWQRADSLQDSIVLTQQKRGIENEALRLLPTLPYLTATNLTVSACGMEELGVFWTAMSERLEVLTFACKSEVISLPWQYRQHLPRVSQWQGFKLHLSALRRLRVFVSALVPEDLDQLTQLEYVHLDLMHIDRVPFEIIRSVRRLSCAPDSRLKSVSLSTKSAGNFRTGADFHTPRSGDHVLHTLSSLTCAPAEIEAEPSRAHPQVFGVLPAMSDEALRELRASFPAAPASLADFALRGCTLSDPAQFDVLAAMPQLRRVTLCVARSLLSSDQLSAATIDLVDRLTHLSLTLIPSDLEALGRRGVGLAALRFASHLRSLQLQARHNHSEQVEIALADVIPHGSVLESLRLGRNIAVDSLAPLLHAARLRKLDVEFRPTDVCGVAEIVCQLPDFQQLEVTVHPAQTAQQQQRYRSWHMAFDRDGFTSTDDELLQLDAPRLLAAVARSRSWRALFLHISTFPRLGDITYYSDPLRNPFRLSDSDPQLAATRHSVDAVTAERFRVHCLPEGRGGATVWRVVPGTPQGKPQHWSRVAK